MPVIREETGKPWIIEDTLTSLVAADPGGRETEQRLPEGSADGVFEAWAHAHEHVYSTWTRLTDVANLQPEIPLALREAADLVVNDGAHLGRPACWRASASPTADTTRRESGCRTGTSARRAQGGAGQESAACGQLALAEGQPADAVAAFEESRDALFRREAFNPAETTFLVDFAFALVSRGRMDEASALLHDMQERAQRFGEPRPIGLIHLALGGVFTGGDALESYERAVAVLASSPYRLDAARAHAELGAALRRRNRRIDAREHLRTALDYAQRNGVEPLARRAEEELRATGARPRRLVVTGVAALTASEARIARLAAGGLTNRQIAQQLFLTVKTIEMHLAAAYRTLGVASRKELPAALGVSEEAEAAVAAARA